MRDEIFVSITLRVGVALAALASLVGAVVYLAAPTNTLADFTTFHAVHIAPGLTGIGLLSLGVAILIATPIVRVAILIIVFLRERDWLYTAVSAFVLGVLLLSLHG
jgi:uncharacterized membrane protein